MTGLALVAAIFAAPVHHHRYHGPPRPAALFPSLHIQAPPAEQPTPDPAEAPPEPDAPPPVVYPSRTGVDEDEYTVFPAHGTLAAGPVELNAHNYGQDDHDLTVADADGVILAQAYLTPGQETQISLTLAAGTYRLYCSLYDGAHDQLGMHAPLVVK